MNELLMQRRRIKKRKPNFVSKDSNKRKDKNKLKWRKPRGLHNKRRLKKKGHQKNPSTGYKSPSLVRGLSRSGFEIYHINSFNQLKEINKEKNIIILSSKIGLKNKLKILEVCLKEDIKVSNIKDISKFLDDSRKNFQNKKRLSKEKIKKKKKKEEELSKKKEKKSDKKDKEDNQEGIKEKVLGTEQDKINIKSKQDKFQQDTTKSKQGHMARSIPGTKQ